MMGNLRALALAGVSGAVLALGAGDAMAGAFGIREQSTIAAGLADAGAASGAGGVSSMFWNPATVTMRPGWVSEQNFTFINLSGDIRTQPGTTPGFAALGDSGDIGQGAVVPSGATSYQLNDRLWVGLQTGAPFGLVTKPNPVWAGEVYARSSRIFSLNINPVIGYKVNEWLSVAAGPTFEYFKLNLKSAFPFSPLIPPANLPTAILKGESWGVGFTAGVLVTPWAGTQVGVGYRSSVNHGIEGLLLLPPINPLIAPRTAVKAILDTPDKVSFGITQALSPVARVNFGFEWDNWSRLGVVPVRSLVTGAAVQALPLNYKDGFTYSVGAEYDWSPALTLRAGVSYEESPIDFSNRSARLPDADRVNVAIGASYRWSEKLTLNAAYSHLFVDRGRLLAGPGRDYDSRYIAAPAIPITFAGVADGSADIVSVGFRYVFGEPAAPIAATPLVRKY
ncbi:MULTISPECIES: OmpP1/FadL family transporter [Methylobacterium]|uniref:OmpP1/FadL family transporter n=1 Tax=Methylobacterium TaxID=407 RepID=UPI0010461A00|nr:MULTISPECIES: outer membrane protein transport protein [Methylobacterium]MDR7036774.1 long-chain fatty acid transport protein [Methylobacterium sp. BE186]